MRARMAGTFIAVATAALLTSGCGAATAGVTVTRGAATTPTASALPMIPWRKVAFPAGVDLQDGTGSFAISYADGHVAWICAPSGPDQFAVWATADAGASWRRVSAIVPVARESPANCVLTPDLNDPQALEAQFWWGCGECGTIANVGYYSTDGGAHWDRLAGDIQRMSRSGATTYAIVSNATPESVASTPPRLVASTDALRTWRTISPPDPGAQGGVVEFAVAPDSDEMLAATQDDAVWHSTDGGSTWSKLALTRTSQSPQDYGLHWLGGQGRWMICVNDLGATDGNFCSTDLGNTWWQVHIPTYTIMCPKCGKGFPVSGQVTPCLLSGPTADGAFLVECPTTIPTGIEPYEGTYTIESLALDDVRWEPVGSAPGVWLDVAGHGILWCRNVRNDSLEGLYVAPGP